MSGRTLLVLLLLWVSPQAPAALRNVGFDAPRAFGYVIGDVFTHLITITVDDPWQLDPASLPGDARIGLWFERRVVRFDRSRVERGTAYELELAYQIFNAPAAPLEVYTPALELQISNGTRQMPVFIREWGVTVVPVTQRNQRHVADYPDLQPPHAPTPRSRTAAALLLAAGGAGLLFSFSVLGYLYAGLPGVARTRGPFALALKRIRALRGSYPEPEEYRRALRYLHQAFNETAGRVVTCDQLDRYFAEHPRQAGLREPIEQLFSRTRAEFFEPGHVPRDRDVAELRELCRCCRDLERGLQ